MTENSEVAELFSNYVIPNYARKPIAFVRGKGTRVWDSSGKVYLDFLGGIAVQGAGHWVQQERPEQVSTLLLQFLAAARAS